MGFYWKIQFLGGWGGEWGGPHEEQYVGCVKRGLEQLAGLRGGLAKKKGWCFWGGDTLMHTMGIKSRGLNINQTNNYTKNMARKVGIKFINYGWCFWNYWEYSPLNSK